MLTREESRDILKLLKKEVVPAVGCTEPMAVALAVAKAKELLQQQPEQVVARLSSRILKNSFGVGIPGSEGMIGLPAAIALSVAAGQSELGLKVLNNISSADIVFAKQYIAEHRCQIKYERNTFEVVYIEIEARAGEHVAKVIIAKEHTRFILLKLDEEVLLDERSELAESHNRCHESSLSMQKVWEFATKTTVEDLRFLLDGARMNKDVAQKAFEGDYGLNLGRMLKGGFEERMVGQTALPRVVCYTCAACDVRMSGAPVPVMTNSGSGNRGIAATLPVLIYAEETMATESKLVRALTMSHLTVIYIQQLLGSLSAHCSCVIAATGSAVGMSYMMGGDYNQICAAVKNMIAGLTGMLCDGAKPSCSMKLSSAVSSAFQAAMMSMEGICVASTDGIIEDDVDRSLHNLADIGLDAVLEVDSTLLNIVEEKE